MEAPCLAHKFERLSSTSDGPRPDIRPNLLREGEVSPYKICVVILLREHYSLQELRTSAVRTDEERIASLRCLYDLICAPDQTFDAFKLTIQNPVHCMRTEVVQSVLSILQELERNNVGFLEDFTNTVLEIQEESSTVTLLKKKIGKNSPFGRFVRVVLMGIRKMSHSQTVHTYKELCLYIGLAYNLNTSRVQKPDEVKKFVAATQETLMMEQGDNTAIVQTQMMEQDTTTALEKSISDTQIDDELDMSMSPGTPPASVDSLFRFQSPNTSSVGIAAEVEVKTILSTPASITKPIGFIFDKMEKMVPYDQSLTFNSQTLTAPLPNTTRRLGLDTFEQMRRLRIERNLHGLGPGLYTSYNQNMEEIRAQPFPVAKVEHPPISQNDPTSACSSKLNNTLNPKFWSRQLVESTIKTVTHGMNIDLIQRDFSSKDVSTFVTHAKTNPSAKVLLPQLHYMDYLSSLQIKDISRSTEALRASFDLRIKPTTSELSKAIPYASYNFAVLYDRLGFKKDAKKFLEEAFQSGHSAGDETCLDYCHNLWSQFEGVQCRDLLTTKDAIGKRVAHLYTIKDIASVLEKLNSGGHSQLDIINELFKCTPAGLGVETCDIVQAEGSQLQTLVSILITFGWFKMATLPCLIIMHECKSAGWPSSTYCTALCSMAQLHLLEGKIRSACELMDTGRSLFESETNNVGELFNKQFALFQALVAYLGYVPLSDSLLATIAAFDPVESLYWLGFNKMVNNDFDGGCKILKQLSKTLSNSTPPLIDLKIRCLLLQAELYCLTNNPTIALPFLFEALELAQDIHSDYYITLTLISLASVQHRLGLYNMATRTLQTHYQALLRSNCRLLTAKSNLLNIKLFLSMEISDPVELKSEDSINWKKKQRDRFVSFFSTLAPRVRRSAGLRSSSPRTKRNQAPHVDDQLTRETVPVLLELLTESSRIFGKWGNTYRHKEILYLKKLIFEYGHRKPVEIQEVQNQLDSIDTHLTWDVKTCVL